MRLYEDQTLRIMAQQDDRCDGYGLWTRERL